MPGFTFTQPGQGRARAAGALDAVREAIGTYMGLRQQKVENVRASEADSRAARALDIQAKRAEDEHQQYLDSKSNDEEKTLQYLIGSYGGQEATPDTLGLIRKHPEYWQATEQQMTLPAVSPAMSAAPPQLSPGNLTGQGGRLTPTEGAMSTIEQRLPAAPTGTTLLRTPESERVRVAQMNAYTQMLRDSSNNASRASIAGMQINARAKIAATQAGLAQARIALQREGMQLTDLRAQRLLDSLEQRFNASQTNDELDVAMRLSANPLIMLGVTQPPTTPPRQQVPPGGIGGGYGNYDPLP